MKVKIEVTNDNGETVHTTHEVIMKASDSGMEYKVVLDQIIDDEQVVALILRPLIRGVAKV